jgi:hypothetical protein
MWIPSLTRTLAVLNFYTNGGSKDIWKILNLRLPYSAEKYVSFSLICPWD